MKRGMTDTPSARLKLAMEKAGVSAAELARRTGYQAGTIRAAANGYADVRPAKAEKYARHLGVEPQWILYGKGKGPAGVVAPPVKATAASALVRNLDKLPATERAHIIAMVDGLVRRVPEVVAFVQADIEAAAEEKLLEIQMSAADRAYMIMTIAKRAEVAARKAQQENKPPKGKALKFKA